MTSTGPLELESRVARLLLLRLQLRALRGDEAEVEGAIDVACRFFEHHAGTTAAELSSLFEGVHHSDR